MSVKKTQIKVIYNIPTGLDTELDSLLKYAIERLGGEWYAQGLNNETGDRDICFDLEYHP